MYTSTRWTPPQKKIKTHQQAVQRLERREEPRATLAVLPGQGRKRDEAHDERALVLRPALHGAQHEVDSAALQEDALRLGHGRLERGEGRPVVVEDDADRGDEAASGRQQRVVRRVLLHEPDEEVVDALLAEGGVGGGVVLGDERWGGGGGGLWRVGWGERGELRGAWAGTHTKQGKRCGKGDVPRLRMRPPMISGSASGAAVQRWMARTKAATAPQSRSRFLLL